MATTLLELRDKIKIDANIEGHPKFPSLRLDRMINEAQWYVQGQLAGLGMKRWEEKETFIDGDLSQSTFGGKEVETLTLPVDLLESPNSIPFIEIEYTLAKAIMPTRTDGLAYEIDKDVFFEQLNNTYLAPVAAQPVFTRIDNTIYIAPGRTGAGAETITGTIHYYERLAELASDTTESGVPDEFIEFVIKKVVSEIDGILGRLQDKELASKQLERDMAKAYEQFNVRNMEDKNRIASQEEGKLQ